MNDFNANNLSSLLGVLVVVLLGKLQVLQEWSVHSLGGALQSALWLLDTVSEVLSVVVVGSVVL